MPILALLLVVISTNSVGPDSPLVQFRTLDGQTRQGVLQAFEEDRVVVQIDSETTSVPTRDLQWIRPSEPGPAPEGAERVWVTFADQSQVVASELTAAEGRISLTLRDGRTLAAAADLVETVRFYPPHKDRNEQFASLVARNEPGDRLIVRRSEQSLDLVAGIVKSVGADEVLFQLDDMEVPVKRTKLEGIAFFQKERELPSPLCKVTTHEGATWNAAKVALAETEITLTTTAGLDVRFPWNRLQSVDFGFGNLVYLSDLEPERAEWTPYLEGSALQEQLNLLFGPRMDRGFSGGPISLGKRTQAQVFEKGLALHSRTILVFRLTDEYRKFLATAGIDTQVVPKGNVQLAIFGDDRELLRKSITGEQAPQELEVDIVGVKRLKILVDYGENLDIADHLNLANARIAK